MTKEQFAKYLDMTLLKPEASRDDIVRFCEQARAVQPASVCLFPIWIKTARKVLEGSGVPVGTVAGFPTGCSTRPVKMQEVKAAILAGAEEVDFVVNLGALKSGDWDEVEREMRDLLETARVTAMETGVSVKTKVIIECCLLTDEEKVHAAQLCRDLAADYVKTSTGFSRSGATVEDVRLLRETVGPNMGVKAAGGIRDAAAALAMIEAGATRIGTSAAAEMVAGFESLKAG